MSSATGGAQPASSEQAAQQPPASDAVPYVAARAAVPGPTTAAPAAGSFMGQSSGMMVSSIGFLMHATNVSGAPPTTPTKRNLLSYRSPSVGRSAKRTISASGSSSSAGMRTANGIVSTAASSFSSPAPVDGDSSSSHPHLGRRTPGRGSGTATAAAAVCTGAIDDVGMTMLRSGGSNAAGRSAMRIWGWRGREVERVFGLLGSWVASPPDGGGNGSNGGGQNDGFGRH
ncbi:hypothetical protein CF326_g6110 [Tilletia indica]|nr:hypothetical protein CF326_g6110 [Tilletia indica]